MLNNSQSNKVMKFNWIDICIKLVQLRYTGNNIKYNLSNHLVIRTLCIFGMNLNAIFYC
jgi:hypothetical protein